MRFLAQGIQPALGIGYRIAKFGQLSVTQLVGSARSCTGRIIQDILSKCTLGRRFVQPLHGGVCAIQLLRIVLHLCGSECGLHAQLNAGELPIHQIQLLII